MKKILGLSIVLFICAQAIFAQTFISAVDLNKKISDKNTVIIDARKSDDYVKVHIKGAINVDIVNEMHTKTPVEGMLKDAKTLTDILGKKGVSQDKQIVVYCKSGVNAGRLYWILKYLGVKDVKMLDGHMTAWRAARKPVTKIATKLAATTFTASINSSILVDKAYVKSKLSSAVLVDARKTEDFDAGHIGSAISLPHKQLMNEETHKAKTKAELTTIFTKAGITKDKEVILYCKTGTKAGLLYFLLTSVLDYTNVKVYDGSYNEWK